MAGLKVHDVAARLNVSEKTVYKWLRQGLIPASRIGKSWIVTEESLQALLSPASGKRLPSNERAGRPPRNPGLGVPASVRNPAFTGSGDLAAAAVQLSGLITSAAEQGVIGILGPRRLDPSTPAAIASELKAADGEVLLQGVGLREFFGDREHAVILRRMAVEDRSVSVRALLVNPTGQFARARTVAEDGEQFADDALFRAGPLFGDSWRSLNVIASLRKASRESKRFSLDVRFVDHWPSAYFVLTDSSAFIETYHFGKVDANIDNVTIEGLVPMLRLSSSSNYYSLLRNHFDYLWAGRNPLIPTYTLEQVVRSVQIDAS